MGRRNLTRWIVASLLFILATPFVIHMGALEAHAAAYNGTCGPHAPDIPVHACTRAAYDAEFNTGFAGVGLLILELCSAVLVGVSVAVGWLIRAFLVSRTRRASDR